MEKSSFWFSFHEGCGGSLLCFLHLRFVIGLLFIANQTHIPGNYNESKGVKKKKKTVDEEIACAI